MSRRAKQSPIPTTSHSFTPYVSSVASSASSPPFPPQHKPAFYDAVLDEILQERVSSSHNRRNPRAVKRKMSAFPRKRPTGRPPLPKINIKAAVRVLSGPSP